MPHGWRRLYQMGVGKVKVAQQGRGKRTLANVDYAVFEELLGSAAVKYSFALNAALFLAVFVILATALLANLPNFL